MEILALRERRESDTKSVEGVVEARSDMLRAEKNESEDEEGFWYAGAAYEVLGSCAGNDDGAGEKETNAWIEVHEQQGPAVAGETLPTGGEERTSDPAGIDDQLWAFLTFGSKQPAPDEVYDCIASRLDGSYSRARFARDRARLRQKSCELREFIVLLTDNFVIDNPTPVTSRIAFRNSATVYGFPGGMGFDGFFHMAKHEIVQRRAGGQDVHVYKMETAQEKQALHDAMGRIDGTDAVVEWLLNDGLVLLDGGDVYILSDEYIDIHEAEVYEPLLSLRGGSGDEDESSAHQGLESTSPVHDSLTASFNHTYDQLLQHAASTCQSAGPPSPSTEAWMDIASALDARNRHLEHELATYTELSSSLAQDVYWQLTTQDALESALAAATAEIATLASEHKQLKQRCNTLRDCMPPPPPPPPQHLPATTTIPHPHSPPSFLFYPRSSTLVFPEIPPRILAFPPHTSLPEIHAMLDLHCAAAAQNNPYAARAREIMQTREAMGVQLPAVFGGEHRVVISVPDGVVGDGVEEGVGEHVRIEAWEAVDGEEAWGVVRVLGGLGVDEDEDARQCDAGDLCEETLGPLLYVASAL
ncbi:hypothetical protein ACN47E_001950 [Coniothyrium glycines]